MEKFFDRPKTHFANKSPFLAATFYIDFLLPVVFEALLPSPEKWLPGEFYVSSGFGAIPR